MAYYLVKARPKKEGLVELFEQLEKDAFLHLRPFGKALTHGLRNARLRQTGIAVWEEEDYCSPPLAEERAAVLDDYFEDIEVEQVQKGEGWQQIKKLPKLFPQLADT
ncbi:MAG: hypothetical protein U5K69_12705 [Balneolaceae bacterium]|nr:hypothetical protein [Balneolaceae bacterium]